MEKLELSAAFRPGYSNSRHGSISVFQNGGNAGTLCVDSEHAQAVLAIISHGAKAIQFVREVAADDQWSTPQERAADIVALIDEQKEVTP